VQLTDEPAATAGAALTAPAAGPVGGTATPAAAAQ
jgi:hypothetical protein